MEQYMEVPQLLIYSIYISIVSVVFSCILIEEDMIFSFYGRLLDRLPDWLGDPLGLCAYCFGGQIAFWYYFFLDGYSIFYHIVFVSITIFIIHITLWIYERTS